MSRIFKIEPKKVGLPPGTLVHVGEERTEAVKITILDYDSADFREFVLDDVEICQEFKESPTVTWIDVVGIHQLEVIEAIGRNFGIHPLVLEDIVNTQQRPKMEDFDDYLFIVLKMLHQENDAIIAEQVSLIVGPKYVISFQEEEGDTFGPVRDRIRKAKGRIRKNGSDYLAYALIDAVVDHYFLILEDVGEYLENLEEEVMTNPSPETAQTIHNLKREMIFLRKSVWPLREVISLLARGESPLFGDPMRIYLRDVYDHTIQVVDTIETFRDVLSGMLDVYLASTSNKMNEVMKVLTIIATIFIPLTLVAGIYGMNFEYMPELEWHWGYPTVMLLMFMLGIIMVIYFKKRRWL